MNETPEVDAALLLDMIQAARAALSFLEGVDEAEFRISNCISSQRSELWKSSFGTVASLGKR